MKKLICCLLVLAIIFSFAFTGAAWAEEASPVEIETQFGKLELVIDESRWDVLTRDNLKDNPTLESMGLDPDEEAKFYAENSIYADAILFYSNSNAYLEMIVIEKELKQNYDFSRFSDKMLEDVAKAVGKEKDGQAGVFSGSNGLKFVYCEYKGEGLYVREYYTGMGESRLNFQFQSNEPFIDEEYEEMEKIMSGIRFTPKDKSSFKIPSLLDVLSSLGLDIFDDGEKELSRFALETEAGTLSLEMDEKFWYVFTRDNLKDNPELEELELDPDEEAKFMEENNVIMDAIEFYNDSDAYLQLLIRETEIDNYYDLSKVSDAEFEKFAEETAVLLGRESVEVFKSDKGLKFMAFEFFDSGTYVKEYITLAENRNFDILFQSNGAFIDDEYEEMETILNSFDFTPKAKTKDWANVIVDA